MKQSDPWRAFRRAASAGGAVGVIVFAALLASGTGGRLFGWQRLSDFYDAQAHAFLRGDLAVDPYPLGIEAFFHHGHAYLYQGPVPALLRLPVVAVAGDRLDGRLTAASMLAALAVALRSGTRLHWRVRERLRGVAPVGRLEGVVVAVFSFAVAASLLSFQASRVWVYHEAILWGVAFTLAAVDQLVAYRSAPSRRSLALASAFATLALLSRASVGIGPLVGLGLVAAGTAWQWLRSRRVGPVTVVGTAAAAFAPLVSYVAVNFAKFETLLSVPFRDQRYSQIDALRQQFLDANGGTFFGLQFVPTTLLRYLTPTGLRPLRHFPFVDLAAPPGSRVSIGATFDVIDRTAGAPVAQPLFFVLAVVGLVAVVRRPSLAPIRLPVVAAAASAATIFPFGYIAYRYLGDAVPLFVLCGAAGLQQLLVIAPRSRRRRRALAAAAVVAGALGTWINLGAALQYQRLWSAEEDPRLVAGYLGFRADVDDRLGQDPRAVEWVARDLPDGVGRPGAIAVVGDCDGLYFSDGEAINAVDRSPWNPVERSSRAGHLRLAVTLPSAGTGTRLPVLEAGDDAFVVTYLPGGRVRFDHSSNDVARNGLPQRAKAGDRLVLDVEADWRVAHVAFRVGDVVAIDNYYFERQPLRITWPHAYDELPVTTPLCRRLVAASR